MFAQLCQQEPLLQATCRGIQCRVYRAAAKLIRKFRGMNYVGPLRMLLVRELEMSTIFERVASRWRTLPDLIESKNVDWFFPLLLTLLAFLPAGLKWAWIWLWGTLIPWLLSKSASQSNDPVPISENHGKGSNWTLPTLDANDVTLNFAMYVLTSCLAVSFFIFLVSVLVYIFSSDPVRSGKAREVSKSTFTFIIASGGGAAVHLGFTWKT